MASLLAAGEASDCSRHARCCTLCSNVGNSMRCPKLKERTRQFEWSLFPPFPPAPNLMEKSTSVPSASNSGTESQNRGDAIVW